MTMQAYGAVVTGRLPRPACPPINLRPGGKASHTLAHTLAHEQAAAAKQRSA